MRWAAGLRSAVAFGLPALIFVVAGYSREALIVSVGAFAVMYGEGRPYRARWRAVVVAGAGLAAAAVLGAAVGTQIDGLWPAAGKIDHFIEVALLSVIACVAVFIVSALRAGPPGAFFFMLVCAVGMGVARAGIPVGTVAACAVVGIVSSVVVSMAGMLFDRSAPERAAVARAVGAIDAYVELRERGEPAVAAHRAAAALLHGGWVALYDAGIPQRAPDSDLVTMLLAKHRQFIGVVAADPAEQLDPPLPLGAAGKRSRAHRSLTVHSHAAVSATRALVASGVAGSVGILLDLGRPDWAVISAVLVVHQGPDRIVGTVRGLHRLVGTVVGLALFAVAYQVGATGAALVLLLMVLMFLIDLMIARNYGVAVMFITPVALLIGGVGASGGPIAAPMRDRLIETLIGVVVALATLWLVVPRAHRHNLKWADARVLDSTAGLLHALRTENPNSDAALVLRRDLQLDLVIDDECGHRAVRDEVEWARLHWSRHTDTIRVGYDLLLQCWETPPGELIADPDGWATRIEKARSQ